MSTLVTLLWLLKVAISFLIGLEAYSTRGNFMTDITILVMSLWLGSHGTGLEVDPASNFHDHWASKLHPPSSFYLFSLKTREFHNGLHRYYFQSYPTMSTIQIGFGYAGFSNRIQPVTFSNGSKTKYENNKKYDMVLLAISFETMWNKAA